MSVLSPPPHVPADPRTSPVLARAGPKTQRRKDQQPRNTKHTNQFDIFNLMSRHYIDRHHVTHLDGHDRHRFGKNRRPAAQRKDMRTQQQKFFYPLNPFMPQLAQQYMWYQPSFAASANGAPRMWNGSNIPLASKADLRKTGRRSQYGKSGRPHAMLSNSLQRQARSNLGRRNKRNGPRRFRGDSYRPAHHSVHDRSSNTVSEEESKSSTATADQSAASDQEVDKLLDEAFAELGLDEDESGDGDESEEDWEAADYSTPPLSQWEYPEASYERDRETFYRIGGTNLNTSFIGSDFPTNFLEDVNSLT
ncbi:uncharacterized protein SPPG_07341 [Spizellomyces punctatus DAOM BR117]|uniref:Uncharacterized protein n=1 Tax=Spizellomyces punctatus (strain DAOM BR117) TaxID=645134 RepID=A0A0L0H902_SPIPD|nr:uncharacterized protein SPPG_07341 [Spizellomyces punctatus DAOM BR117]KNC97419.1 hypothetical protein SPPG_07341 [Spizellomyces punctatus DAOM BR117]|eukprot:XP_016605459.1 hypothetical protein SPPG_07341 [Spizellomyces punctatus DAOM BR117]